MMCGASIRRKEVPRRGASQGRGSREGRADCGSRKSVLEETTQTSEVPSSMHSTTPLAAAVPGNRVGSVRVHPWLATRAAPAVLASLALIACWWIHPKPLDPHDLLAYSQLGFELSRSWFEGASSFGASPGAATNVFSHRFTVFAPLGLLYGMFGVSMAATTVWPLIAMISIVWGLAWTVSTTVERWTAIALLCSASTFFFQMVTLTPDIFVAAAALAFFFAASHRERPVSFGKCTGLLAIAFFVGLSAKVTMLWVGVVWLVLVLDDSRHRRWVRVRRFHASALSAWLLAGAASLALSEWVWGDPLARLEALRAIDGNHLWSWSRLGPSDRVARMTYAPMLALLEGFGVVFAFGVAGLFRRWEEYPTNKKALIALLLLYQFGSTSLSRYEPLPLNPRMILLVLPLLCISGAELVTRTILSDHRIPKRDWIALAVASVLFVAHMAHHPDSEVVLATGMLGLGSIGIAMTRHRSRKISSGMVCWAAALVLFAGSAVAPARRYTKDLSEGDELRAVAGRVLALASAGAEVRVFTGDGRSPSALPFHFGYRTVPGLNLERAETADEMANACRIEKSPRVLFFHDRLLSNFLRKAYGEQIITPEALGSTPTVVHASERFTLLSLCEVFRAER